MSEFEKIALFDLEEGSGEFYKQPADGASAQKQAASMQGLRKSDLRVILADAGRIRPAATPAPVAAERPKTERRRDYTKLVIVERSAFHRGALRPLLERESYRIEAEVDFALKANPIFEKTDAGVVVIDLDEDEQLRPDWIGVIRKKFNDVAVVCSSDRYTTTQLDAAGIRNVVLMEKPYTESSVRRALAALAALIQTYREN